MSDAKATKVHAQVLRQGGMPVTWAAWGTADVTPGQNAVVGSGMGPFFNVVGIPDGAIFTYGTLVSITLHINGTSSQQFQLPNDPAHPFQAGNYMAMVDAAK